MRISCNYFILAISCLLISMPQAFSREHQIYSVEEEVPMGYENETLKKNYYVNIGENQGVTKGTTLNVFRIISKLNPYENQKRVNHRIKIGELKVLHADEEAAIGAIQLLNKGDDTPLFEIENFMIGDHVSVNISN
ncbi:MAG: hypothetical protein KC478_15435 [Bacteriovoracaceae bacterium]|nr:hypothetical protein [Bacteriovoracaceae bacterium]